MATESTKPIKLLAPGEAATDLVEALDALAERAHRREVSVEDFLDELYRIDHDLQQRLGMTPTRRYHHLPNEDPEEESTPTQRLNLFWRNTRRDALNTGLEQLSEADFWEETEDQHAGPAEGQSRAERLAD